MSRQNSKSSWMPSRVSVLSTLNNLALLGLGASVLVGVVSGLVTDEQKEEIKKSLGPEGFAACEKIAETFGYCLLSSMLPPGKRLDSRGVHYDCSGPLTPDNYMDKAGFSGDRHSCALMMQPQGPATLEACVPNPDGDDFCFGKTPMN